MKIALALLFILQLHSIQLQLISGSKVSADSNSHSKGNNIETKNDGKSMSKRKEINSRLTNFNKTRESTKEVFQIMNEMKTMIKYIRGVFNKTKNLIKDLREHNKASSETILLENELKLLNNTLSKTFKLRNEMHLVKFVNLLFSNFVNSINQTNEMIISKVMFNV
uniref:Uncharacterized protein n=1 Tax=Schistosoma japonicum TaxID=6182 RepID=C1LLQ6_SCHJA|nr:hypothetical protein [Schistosoma japonicum]CAX75635.1 hypothetical protein [Schistosoma japonicum]CAX75636.1 hypothetical protein [Schistosoma japonicum]